jgi:hypothetical protein
MYLLRPYVGNSVFCGPETAIVAQKEDKRNAVNIQ